MGIAEPDVFRKQLIISSHIITYGHAADHFVTELIREEIETLWNEPGAEIRLEDWQYRVAFHITAAFQPAIRSTDIYHNADPRNNYFRIEEFANGNISFVDGLGCNSGYFKLENLYKGSTTAAHEYGHTLGLAHPHDLDLRGQGVPGIMYPRGTLVDPPFQYNPGAMPGDNRNGGTMHPKFRKVKQEDIGNLRLSRLRFTRNSAIVGAFTNTWHEDHARLKR